MSYEQHPPVFAGLVDEPRAHAQAQSAAAELRSAVCRIAAAKGYDCASGAVLHWRARQG